MTRAARSEIARGDAAQAGRRTLALVFPWLPIERLRATRPHLFVAGDPTAIAFVATVRAQTRLVALDPAAARAGLTVGLTLAAARARVPDLAVYDDDPAADHQWLERLAARCGRYGAAVTLRPPDALTLDMAGAGAAFASEHGLAADLETRLARGGVTVRHACGDTSAIAEALARFAGAPAPDERGAVRRLPIAALGLGEDADAALAQAGMRTLGDVMAPSRAALAARFGIEVAAAVRALTDHERMPPAAAAAAAAPTVRVERHLSEPLTRTAGLLAVVAELIGEAGAVLAGRSEAPRRWRLQLYRAAGDVEAFDADAGRATADPAMPMRLLRERMAALVESPEAHQRFDLIRLDVVVAEPIGAGELDLEGGAIGGMDAEGGAVPGRGPRPRAARSRRAVAQVELLLPAVTPGAADRPIADRGVSPRPIHLFDPPQPIEEVCGGDGDGPPRQFRWRRTLHEVARVEGPERHAAGQCRGPVGTAAAREYYRVEDRRGRRLWIYRDAPATADDRGAPRWFVHGVFA